MFQWSIRLGTSAETPDTIKICMWWEMAIVLTLVEGQRALLLRTPRSVTPGKGIVYGDLQCALLWGWVSYLEPLGERGPTQSPLGDCCELDLLKCTIPGVEHTPLKEGRRWGSWPGASRPQPISLYLTGLPPPPKRMICMTRASS